MIKNPWYKDPERSSENNRFIVACPKCGIHEYFNSSTMVISLEDMHNEDMHDGCHIAMSDTIDVSGMERFITHANEVLKPADFVELIYKIVNEDWWELSANGGDDDESQ